MPILENGPVKIHYEEAGSGFPLLVQPGGGLEATIAGLDNHAFNPLEEFCDIHHVAALDLRIQAEILDLLQSLCERRGLTFLFISHDLNVVGAVCDRIAVMQAGEIVEEGPADQILSCPQHPYTQRLLSSRPGQESQGRVA